MEPRSWALGTNRKPFFPLLLPIHYPPSSLHLPSEARRAERIHYPPSTIPYTIFVPIEIFLNQLKSYTNIYLNNIEIK
jgi:hypothetical protein